MIFYPGLGRRIPRKLATTKSLKPSFLCVMSQKSVLGPPVDSSRILTFAPLIRRLWKGTRPCERCPRRLTKGSNTALGLSPPGGTWKFRLHDCSRFSMTKSFVALCFHSTFFFLLTFKSFRKMWASHKSPIFSPLAHVLILSGQIFGRDSTELTCDLWSPLSMCCFPSPPPPLLLPLSSSLIARQHLSLFTAFFMKLSPL